ncbi:MAG TPA: hypothetical protein VFN32_10895 [Rhodococcus sp. (in: high G+C Gram-positive bacteria)]|jgi:hypothetical protein|nr:hypothetical protein [Rhodococcus sp. (in: high G+C Gram-positive bacteria)]
MDTVERVLSSPRGRRFAAYLGYTCSLDERASNYREPFTRADALDVLAAVDAKAVTQLSELDVLEALGRATDFARYWQPPDEEDLWFADPALVAALTPIVDAVLASEHARWWSAPMDPLCQRAVQKRYNFTEEWSDSFWANQDEDADLSAWRRHVLDDEGRFRRFLDAEPERQISGEWWSTPVPSRVRVTSRAREKLGAVELLLAEDDISDGLHARVWPVHVDASARVYEITGPDAWARLVDAYPLAVPASRRSDWYDTTGKHLQWYLPDWAAVAADYDAVHLTVLGYLTTPGLAIPLIARSGASVLAGWDPDATFWLDPRLVRADGGSVEWCRTQDTPWAPTSGV